MAKRKASKKIESIEIEINEPLEILISEKDQIKIDLKEIELLLNRGNVTKNRTALLTSQMELQIKLKNLK